MFKININSNPQFNTANRIESMDILRGFALLGILLVNIRSFSMIFPAYLNPTAFGNLTGINYWVWFWTHLLIDSKFIAIFGILFGASIYLMTQRHESTGLPHATIHYRRMLILLVIGLIHAYVFWYGDILFTFAISGMLVYLFRKLSVIKLILLGLAGYAFVSIIYFSVGILLYIFPSAMYPAMMPYWSPEQNLIDAEIQIYQSGWFTQMQHRAFLAFQIHTQSMLFLLPGMMGLMLLGIAYFKLGILNAGRSISFYFIGLILSACIAIPLILLGIRYNFQQQWDLAAFYIIGYHLNYWGALILSFSWICCLMIFYRFMWGTLPARISSAIGRMALTNYLLQTLICTTIFYGHGLGLFGKLNRLEQLYIVFIIWFIQAVFSYYWLKYYRFGPMEWLWRNLTYAPKNKNI